MFGYIVLPAKAGKEEKDTYRRAYCGLCHTLGEKYGRTGMKCLSYDMVFLSLLLSDLTDAPRTDGEERCVVHPLRTHRYFTTPVMDYAADMQILLSHYAAIDDRRDEGKGDVERYSAFIPSIKEKYGRQTRALEENLAAIAANEKAGRKVPLENASLFGAALSEVFIQDGESHFAPLLAELGGAIGRFIYLMDAWDDRKRDRRKGLYNPLPDDMGAEEMKEMLLDAAAGASMAFESLPLDEYVPVMKNILYSGIWAKFRTGREKDE